VSGVAPLSVFFDATGTTSPGVTALPFHEIKYTWSFGDAAGGAGWAYGSRVGSSSKNAASGPVAAHLFETPGTYTVTLTAFDGANANSKTATITVTDPNTVFSGNTICVANGATPVAGVGGCPSGAAVQNMPNWSTISTLRATYKRILLKKGDVWSMDGMVNFTGANSAGPGILGAYGSGASPKVLLDVDAQAVYMDGSTDWRIMDLEFASSTTSGSNKVAVVANNNSNLLLLRLHIHDVMSGVVGGTNNGMFVVDSNIHNTFQIFGGIGAYIEFTDRLAILGTRVSTIPGNHCVRVQGSAGLVISNNQIDTPRWNFPAAGNGGHVLAVRGIFGADIAVWTGKWAENMVISDNVLDGSMGSIDAFFVGPTNTGSAERLRNVIAERNTIKSVSNAVYAEVASGLTFRNNLVLTTGSPYSMVVASENTAGSPAPSSTFIYNNTFYKPDASLRNGYSTIFLYYSGTSGAPSGTVIKNNLAYSPADTRDFSGSGSIPTLVGVSGVPSSNYALANNSTDAQIKSTKPWAITNPVNPIDYTPTGYAINSGVYLPLFADYFNLPISGIPSLGAIVP
jgi:PKD repeat protein